MEKSRPHYKLESAKTLIRAGQYSATQTAAFGAAALGMSHADMVAVVLGLCSSDFYKSMTTHSDHTIWQDVYKPKTAWGAVYLKLTVLQKCLIVSFKEL